MTDASLTAHALAEFIASCAADFARAAPTTCHGSSARVVVGATNPPDVTAQLMAIALRPPPGLTILKFGSRSVVGRWALADGQPVILKYYHATGPHKQLAYGLRGSRARKSYLAALALGFAGIPTPRPLLIADWGRLGGLWWQRSFLATRQAAGITLTEWVKQHLDDSAALTDMAARLRVVFERMARYHINHGDLKASNIVVAADRSVSLVDLDAVEFLNSGRKWLALRHRDRTIFHRNWQSLPAHVAGIFSPALTK